MFSTAQKRIIASKVQGILKETRHLELPLGEIQFSLHVNGAEAWSWADIRNNGAITDTSNANSWNEAAQAAAKEVSVSREDIEACFLDSKGELMTEGDVADSIFEMLRAHHVTVTDDAEAEEA